MSEAPQSEKLKSGSESPTTARELDFDDDEQDDTRAAKSPTPTPTHKPKVSFAEDEAPPAKPPRPLSPNTQAANTLIEAFPTVDPKVVKAVLMASNGNPEPAFNALLAMSDPDFKPEEAPPPRPPRPTPAQRQLEADEQYARQLAQQYQQRANYDAPLPPLPSRDGNRQMRPGVQDEDKEYSFFDDDLPAIKENVRKGFVETQSKVNKWISDFRKRLDGEDNDDPTMGPTRQDSPPPRRQNFGSSQSEQLYGIRRSADVSRKSTDRDRYDSDPRVLDDDFTTLELRDEEASSRASSSCNRPLSNPDLFKPHVAPPQSGPVDEVDAIDRRIQRQPSPGAAAKSSAKWQSLTSIAPNPESEENDPFSLGDSDDEKESKTKDLREADSARLKEATRKSSIAGSSDAPQKELQPSERSGSTNTKDKEAEALLTGDLP